MIINERKAVTTGMALQLSQAFDTTPDLWLNPHRIRGVIAVSIFCLAYLGIALEKISGFFIDRVGVALLGAIGMVIFGVAAPESAIQSIDLPTILLLYSLMVISAQLRLGGFYT